MKKKAKKKAKKKTAVRKKKAAKKKTKKKASKARSGSAKKFDQRARQRLLEEAEKQGRLLRLRDLRQDVDVLQRDLPSFSQVSAARIESRNDLLFSTLIRYVEDLNLNLEITAKGAGTKKFTLYKSGKTRRR